MQINILYCQPELVEGGLVIIELLLIVAYLFLTFYELFISLYSLFGLNLQVHNYPGLTGFDSIVLCKYKHVARCVISALT
jgi:hypothetical protein